MAKPLHGQLMRQNKNCRLEELGLVVSVDVKR